MVTDWREVTAVWAGERGFIGCNDQGGEVQIGTVDNKPGVSPMELLLLGLAGCTGVDILNILSKKRQPPDDLKVVVRGKRADTHPKVYTMIEVEYQLNGENIDPKAVEQAIRLSEEKYCSTSAMLGVTAEIRLSFMLNNVSTEINDKH